MYSLLLRWKFPNFTDSSRFQKNDCERQIITEQKEKAKKEKERQKEKVKIIKNALT